MLPASSNSHLPSQSCADVLSDLTNALSSLFSPPTLSKGFSKAELQPCSEPPSSGTLALWVSCDGYNCRRAQLQLANTGGELDTEGAAFSLLSIPSSVCRLDTEERLALQADHGGVQPCWGEEGEADGSRCSHQ